MPRCTIEVVQQMFQASAIASLGGCASNCDPVRSCKLVFTHDEPQNPKTLGPEYHVAEKL